MGKSVRSWSRSAACITLAVLLLIALPLFLCMPVWIDASLYDLAARNVLNGGVHYRDLFDTNLPGMLWMHLAVRGVLGWSTEALRVVDILLFGISVLFLTRLIRRAPSVGEGTPDALSYDSGSALPVWFAVICFVFYFSTSEWCHCQRDLWMLSFALGALLLRRQQVESIRDTAHGLNRLVVQALAEGICWGAAFWIKPFVAVPALVCWLVSAMLNRRAGKRLVVDAAGLVAGGMLAGAPGIVWLIASGAWGPMWDIFLDWNREYIAAAEPLSRRLTLLFFRLKPWGWLHAVAIPFAFWLIGAAIQASWSNSGQFKGSSALLAGFYLGWLAQAVFLQKAYDYTLAPLPLLALALLAGELWPACPVLVRWPALLVLLLLSAVPAPAIGTTHPLLDAGRLALWARCWREGSSSDLRDKLKLLPWERYNPNWTQLDRVREFLEQQGVVDGELTCYHTTTHPLYLQMNFRPTTPYLHFDMILANFPRHREIIREQLAESGQRYVVSDLAAFALNLTPAQIMAEPSDALPADFPDQWRDVFPWSEPILFRAGRYVVHRATSPVVRLLPEKPPSSERQATEGKRAIP